MIKNLSNNKHIAKNAEFCRTIFSRAKGLMFSKKLKGRGLIFIFKKEKKISLHMFFVFYPIDVLFLGKSRIVVDLKADFKPFTFYTSKTESSYVIELPAGAIKASKTKLGDKIDFWVKKQ